MRARDTLTPEIARDLEAMDAAVAGRPHAGGDPLLAELAALVAEARPTPDDAAARRLDARAAAALEAARRPRRRRLRDRLRIAGPALGLAACALVAVVIGLGNTNGRDDATVPAGAGAGSAERSADDAGSASSGATTAEPGGDVRVAPSVASPGDPGSDRRRARKVERSAAMTLAAARPDIDAVAAGVDRAATELGGFVASSSVSSRRGGHLDLRIPSARLDDAIERLSRLAPVRQLDRSTLDITAEAVSAHRRVDELRAERRSLLRRLALAVTEDEADGIRARLRTVDRRLDAARAGARRVENRAAFANVEVELVAERRAQEGGAWTPGDAWHDALRVLEVVAGVALVALAVIVPLALVGVPAWAASRRHARRRRESALDAA